MFYPNEYDKDGYETRICGNDEISSENLNNRYSLINNTENLELTENIVKFINLEYSG